MAEPEGERIELCMWKPGTREEFEDQMEALLAESEELRSHPVTVYLVDPEGEGGG